MNCSVNSENNSNNEIRRRRDTSIGSGCKSCDAYNIMVCIDDRCYCKPNYFYIDGLCLPMHCLPPEWECSQYQHINRHCYNEKCVCDDGYYEDPYNGNKCTLIYATTRSVWTWLWIFIVLPIAFAIIIALYIRGIRMQSRNTDIVSGPQMVSVTQVYPVQQTSDNVEVHQV